MSNDRSNQLLKAAALALGDGRDPFDIDFLADHDITRTECMRLSHKTACILMGFLASDADRQDALLLTGVVSLANEEDATTDTRKIDPAMVGILLESQQAMRKIHDL